MASKMAPDLLTQITNEFGGETINRVAAAIGIGPAKASTALNSLVPAALNGLAGKVSSTEGANDVIDLIRKNNLTSLDADDLARPGALTNLTNIGRSVMDFLFGGRVNTLTDWISTHAGISRASATSLAAVCAPLILGFIGRRLGSTGLNASGLTNLLGGPGKYLQTAPAGLLGALGLGGAAATARHFVEDTKPRVAAAPAYASKPTPSPWKWLLPLLLGAGIVGLLAYMFARPTPTVTTPTVRTEAPAPAAPATAVPAAAVPALPNADLGAFIDTKLPNGVSIHVPTNGVENKLIAFITDSTRAADKETWFSFDRLEFETDSAKLKPSSKAQLASMAEILKAYPHVEVKIGGYTDNSGDAAHNLKLSQDRATSTLNELAGLGINKSRLAAEGYGQQFPVADNATPEGRQRNRRIDIRVTKK